MTAPEDPNGLREALARAVEAGASNGRTTTEIVDDLFVAGSPLASLIAERDAANKVCDMAAMSGGFYARTAENMERRALAAEAEITRLKEGMEARERANDRLTEMVEKLVLNAITGSVPRAIIVAAGDLLDTLSQEHPHG